MELRPRAVDCPTMAKLIDQLNVACDWVEKIAVFLFMLPLVPVLLTLSWSEVGLRRLLDKRRS